MTYFLFLLFGLSILVSLVANWSVRGIAHRIGLVDHPDGHRKLQSHAVPLGGGIGIFVTLLVAIGAIVAADQPTRATVLSKGYLLEAIGLFLGATLIVGVGILDDWVGLRGRQKLAGQVAAATAIWAFGVCIHRINFMGWSVELGILSAPFTIFWLLGAMNALNLLDGIDGLAGIVGIILSASLAFLALATGHETIAVIASVLAGGIAGFLWFNIPPASMYLGDAGSMLIGLLVGVLAIKASLKGPGTVLLAAPLALWTLPILDSAAAILRRMLTGRSIYASDRAHLHHLLVQRIGHRNTLVCVAAVSLLTSAAALLSVRWNDDLIAIACASIVVLMFVGLRVFGHSELVLLLVQARALVRSLFSAGRPAPRKGWRDAVRLQGTRQWELLWETLTEWAITLELVQVRLDVNFPTLGEGYHATWNRPGDGRDDRYWTLQMPLIAEQNVVGSVRVIGERWGGGEHSLEQLLELVEQIESHLRAIAATEKAVPAARRDTADAGLTRPDRGVRQVPVEAEGFG
ncbi:MAG: MraY family glycosyltransferase [Planctomycetaceae bacterium]